MHALLSSSRVLSILPFAGVPPDPGSQLASHTHQTYVADAHWQNRAFELISIVASPRTGSFADFFSSSTFHRRRYHSRQVRLAGTVYVVLLLWNSLDVLRHSFDCNTEPVLLPFFLASQDGGRCSLVGPLTHRNAMNQQVFRLDNHTPAYADKFTNSMHNRVD